MNPSIEKLAQLMQARQEQGEPPYVLLLGSSLSLTPAVRRAFSGTEDWEAFWEEMQRASLTERKALLKKPLDALGLELGYQAMARLAEAGYFNLVLTLNVDDAIDDVVRPLSADQSVLLIYDGSNAAQIVEVLSHPTPRIKVVKLRGDINARKLPLTPQAQFEFPPDLEDAVTQWLSRDTIVVGDLPFDDDVQRCLRSGDDALWCILPNEPASDSFIKRAKKIRSSGEIITGADGEFNAFFTALAERLLQFFQTEGLRRKDRDWPPPVDRFAMPVSSQTAACKHNLPAQATPFVGREAELAELARLLAEPDVRLLTVLGAGGMGKTRLVLEAAAAQMDRFAHGVYLISLAPLQSVEAIVPTVAQALSFSFYEEDEPQQQLLDYLRQKTMLLIMDSFEHLLHGVGLVTEVLKTAPEVKILATSRARLNVQGEHLFPIAGMHLPDRETLEDATHYSAVGLFLTSARRSQPSFEPTADDLTDVVRICRLVEGMPLGILLAAAWIQMLTPAEIAAEISQSLDFVETDLRDVPERQRSMRAVFDHSWNLLTVREREVFQGLSVFRGGFTRQAAQRVTGASLHELMALVNKSLLHRAPAPSATLGTGRTGGRYEVHELLRQYVAEKLDASGEADAARDAHSAYYAEFLHQREADLKGRRQLGALDEIEADFENARVAWAWTVQKRDYAAINRALESLSLFCMCRSRDQEGRELFRQAREQLAPGPDDEPHPVWGRILVQEFCRSPHEADKAQVERSLAIAQQHGDRAGIALCLHTLGEIAFNADDYTEALSFYEESLAHFRVLDDSFNIAATLYKLAETYRVLGQPEEAIKSARQSLELSREIGDKYWAASSLANTGVIAFFTGNYAEAEGYLREANTIYREMGYRVGIATSSVVLSKLAFLRGDFEKAKALAEEALEIATDIGSNRVAQSARYLPRLVATTLGEKIDEHPDEEEPAPITDIPTKIDQYEVKRLLAAGDFGAVYLAHDPDSGRDVAIKVANPENLKTRGWALPLKRESVIMAKLAHPAIPEFYGYGEAADHVYIVLEFIQGKDLLAMLEEQEGFLPEKEVIEWAIQVCDGLIHLHGQRPAPFIFRDVKPSNMMIDPYGQVYLIDFGISVIYQPGREQAAIGTRGYSPPEQYWGYTDARSDVYALGATLHHLLTRRDPRKETPFSFHDAPPRSLNPAISKELEAVILKAVEHHPEDRYQSAEEMKTALLACL